MTAICLYKQVTNNISQNVNNTLISGSVFIVDALNEKLNCIKPLTYKNHHKMQMDKYDFMILDIIQNFKLENQNHIRLSVLERNFWKRIEADTDLHVGQARIGERITNLYLDGLIQNKDGYTLTKKGREQLSFAPWNREVV